VVTLPCKPPANSRYALRLEIQASIATSPRKSFEADLDRQESLKAAFEGAHAFFSGHQFLGTST